MTANGSTPPRYKHYDIELAVQEAKRLHELYGSPVEILKVVGEVKTEEVPVVKKEVKVTLNKDEEQDLPF